MLNFELNGIVIHLRFREHTFGVQSPQDSKDLIVFNKIVRKGNMFEEETVTREEEWPSWERAVFVFEFCLFTCMADFHVFLLFKFCYKNPKAFFNKKLIDKTFSMLNTIVL